MAHQENIAVANQFLAGMRDGRDPDELAGLRSDDLDFEIPGDADALPWIGHRRGRKALAEFVRDLRSMTDPIKFEIHDVLASDERAVVVGDLETRFKRTGRVAKSPFCLVFSIEAGRIARFQMLEDSFDVSKAARVE